MFRKPGIQNSTHETDGNNSSSGIRGMRFLKLAVISLLIIFLLFTGIGLLLPSSVTVTRQEFIIAPIGDVRFYTNDLNHWKYWLNGVDTNYKQSSINPTPQTSKIKLGAYIFTPLKNNQTGILQHCGREKILKSEPAEFILLKASQMLQRFI